MKDTVYEVIFGEPERLFDQPDITSKQKNFLNRDLVTFFMLAIISPIKGSVSRILRGVSGDIN